MNKLIYTGGLTAVAIFAAAFLLIAPQHATAQGSCNYNPNDAIKNCAAAAQDYFQKTFGSQSNTYEDVDKRVNSAGDVLKECGNCAMEKFTGSDSSSSSSSSSTSSND